MNARKNVWTKWWCGSFGMEMVTVAVLAVAISATAQANVVPTLTTVITPYGEGKTPTVTITSAAVSADGLWTITDKVEFTDLPGGLLDDDDTGLLNFTWFGMQKDGTEFPRIFSGRVSYSYEEAAFPPWYDPDSVATLQTWQTTYDITTGGGVWFGRITRPNFVTRYPAVTATSWVMATVNLNQDIFIADASLDSTLGTEGQIQVALTSAICRKADGYEYTYTLKNKTDEMVSFNLAAASLDVKLKKGQVYVHSIQSDRPGQESRQVAMVSGKGIGFKNMKTNIIVPMVEQATRKVASADEKNITNTDS